MYINNFNTNTFHANTLQKVLGDLEQHLRNYTKWSTQKGRWINRDDLSMVNTTIAAANMLSVLAHEDIEFARKDDVIAFSESLYDILTLEWMQPSNISLVMVVKIHDQLREYIQAHMEMQNKPKSGIVGFIYRAIG